MSDLREEWEDPGDDWGAPPFDTLAELTAAADGLLVTSEADHPLEPFRWPGPDPITPEALRDSLGLPPDAPAEVVSLDAFFSPLASSQEWFDDAQRATAARFATLRDLIADRLTDVAVYRLGRIEVAVIIAGRDQAGATVGLRTTQVET
ncbi:MAG: hypothetical protein RLZZ387_4256 [Chloroflexota bacterium]